jgi:hypothetical protein
LDGSDVGSLVAARVYSVLFEMLSSSIRMFLVIIPDGQGNDSEELYEEDQHQFDSEDTSDWANCGRVVERVDDAVGGSNDDER